MMSDGLNQLRDELLELRQLRAAAETRGRYEAEGVVTRDGASAVSIWCPACRWHTDVTDPHVTLAELVRRADQHTQDCP